MDRKGQQTPSLDRHTASTLQLNPEFDLTSFSITALEGLPRFEETDNDDDDTFFKTRSKKGTESKTSSDRRDVGDSIRGSTARPEKNISCDIDMDDTMTIER